MSISVGTGTTEETTRVSGITGTTTTTTSTGTRPISSSSDSSVTTISSTSYTSQLSSTTPTTSGTGTTQSTTSTSILTTTATTTTAIGVIPAQPLTVDYNVSQTINAGINLTEGQIIENLRASLSPEFTLIRDPTFLNDTNYNLVVSYTVESRGFGDPNVTRVQDYIEKQTSGFASRPVVTKNRGIYNKL